MRTIEIDPVTRIEGHARVRIDLDDKGEVLFAGMYVNELRGFEMILTGMEVEKMPLITARICGVCPAAHHFASVRTLDRVFDLEPPPAAKLLRELMYHGHMIHSHALSLFVLSGPDLILGPEAPPETRNIVGLVAAAPETAKKALRLRSLGQKILEMIGGRGVHPVTAIAGGIAFKLTEEKRNILREWIKEGNQLGAVLAKVVKSIFMKFMDERKELVERLTIPSYYMATVKDGKLSFSEGLIRVVDPQGKTVVEFDAQDYTKHIVEEALDWSYMKPTYFKAPDGSKQVYRVNTLARLNAVDGMETPQAQKELEAFRSLLGRPCHATLAYHYARLIEMLYSLEKAAMVVEDPAIMGISRVAVTNKPRSAISHVESPRGTLIHDYQVNEEGVVQRANLIVATQQNYAAINETIKQGAGIFLKGPDEDLLNGIEFLIRTYDPCLSCATHAHGEMPLVVEVTHQGEQLREIRRDPPC